MAIPIKAVPILSGEIADDFVQRAEERDPAPCLSREREERIAKVMKQMREFKFLWEKKSRTFYNIPESDNLGTRMYYFDLL